MQRIGGKTDCGEKRFHDSRNYVTGEVYQSPITDDLYIVTNLGPCDAQDEHGVIHRGFAYTLRSLFPDELAERKRQQASRDALTTEQRVENQLENLARMLPSLDWG